MGPAAMFRAEFAAGGLRRRAKAGILAFGVDETGAWG